MSAFSRLVLGTALVATHARCGEASSPASGDATPAPLELVGTEPSDGAVSVALDTPIELTFSTSVDESSISSDTLKIDAEGVPLNGEFSVEEQAVLFVPTDGLPTAATVDVQVTSGLKSTDGSSLSEASLTFSTRGEWKAPTILELTSDCSSASRLAGAVALSDGTEQLVFVSAKDACLLQRSPGGDLSTLDVSTSGYYTSRLVKLGQDQSALFGATTTGSMSCVLSGQLISPSGFGEALPSLDGQDCYPVFDAKSLDNGSGISAAILTRDLETYGVNMGFLKDDRSGYSMFASDIEFPMNLSLSVTSASRAFFSAQTEDESIRLGYFDQGDTGATEVTMFQGAPIADTYVVALDNDHALAVWTVAVDADTSVQPFRSNDEQIFGSVFMSGIWAEPIRLDEARDDGGRNGVTLLVEPSGVATVLWREFAYVENAGDSGSDQIGLRRVDLRTGELSDIDRPELTHAIYAFAASVDGFGRIYIADNGPCAHRRDNSGVWTTACASTELADLYGYVSVDSNRNGIAAAAWESPGLYDSPATIGDIQFN